MALPYEREQDTSPARRLIDALRDPHRYPHPVGSVTVVETHISWVLLAGDYAYKIKKPVDFGFVDFSTLERRQRFCHEELRLNRRLAPAIYLDVVAIGGEPVRPEIGGGEPVIEYAVKMRRFPDGALAGAMLAAGTLTRTHVIELAGRISDFHAAAPAAGRSMPHGEPHAILRSALENITPILTHCGHDEERLKLQALWHWTERHFDRLRETFIERKASDRVRECHGDLHLGNVALLDGKMSAFDGIEFNDDLRWIDVMSEIAFTVMDLAARGRRDLASLFLNTYLERTGDYGGLAVLPFYTVYRALVRAKVECLRSGLRNARLPEETRRYLELAEAVGHPRRAAVVIMHGLSGCGKTAASAELMQHLGAIRIRSDVERKRMAGMEALARSRSGVGADLYDAGITEATYARLARLARAIAEGGDPVVVDAAFLRRTQREAMRALAGELRVPFVIVSLEAPEAVLRDRISARAAAGSDASEADMAVLAHQLEFQEPPAGDELACTVRVDATRPFSGAAWQARLAELAARLK